LPTLQSQNNNMSLTGRIESILFVASKPLSQKKIAAALDVADTDVALALDELQLKYNGEDSGIHILDTGSEYQMATNPQNSDAIDGFIKDEVGGELTRAQLETLTVVAYAGPMTRPELENIRGVNCAVILRNLLIRGLIQEESETDKLMPEYRLSAQALSHLGVSHVQELSGYEDLHNHAHISAETSDDELS